MVENWATPIELSNFWHQLKMNFSNKILQIVICAWFYWYDCPKVYAVVLNQTLLNIIIYSIK